MKKSTLIISIITSLFILTTVAIAVQLPLRIVLDNEKLYFPDEQPFIDGNGRTQTPARFIGEALGAKVSWDGSKQKALFVLDGTQLAIYIGKTEYEINGTKHQMDTKALLQNGRTFVPARYVAEAFGAKVSWDSKIRTVYIKSFDETKSIETTLPQSDTTSSTSDVIDPVTGWVKINDVTASESVEYSITIHISKDNELLNQRYMFAEQIFAEKYGKNFSTEVFTILKNKHSETFKIPYEVFKINDRNVAIWGSMFSVSIDLLKEGFN